MRGSKAEGAISRNSRIPSGIFLGILDFGILDLGILEFPTMSSSGLTRGSLYGILEFLGFLGGRGYFLGILVLGILVLNSSLRNFSLGNSKIPSEF